MRIYSYEKTCLELCEVLAGIHPLHEMRPPCTSLKCYYYTGLLSAVGT
jgi:hypothetical protein